MNIKIDNKVFWLIPVVMVFVLALVLCLNNRWPLSWDVFIHINYALTYTNYGITTVDPLLNAPAGKSIGYVPLFHILLIATSVMTGGNLFAAAKLFEIFIPVIFVTVAMYISYKLYDDISALITGLLLLSSFIFTRMYLPIPESVAIVFFIVGIYLLYQAVINDNKSYALLSGVVSIIILGLHFSSFIYYMVMVTILMIILLLLQKNLKALKYYLYGLSVVVLVAIIGVVFIGILSPSTLSGFTDGMFSIISNPMNLFMGQVAMGLERYIKCLGIIVLMAGIVGLYYSFKYKELLFISSWALVAFVLSNLHWFGIPVYTYRMLIYVLMPAVIIGGFGVSKLTKTLNSRGKIYSIIFIGALIISCCGMGISNMQDPSVSISSASTEYGTYQIAPPTSSQQEVIDWFAEVDQKDKSILSNNMFFATIISSADKMPVHYKFNAFITDKYRIPQSSLEKEKIGYILYDKQLVVNNTTDYQQQEVVCATGNFYPTYFFTKNITDENFNRIKLPYTYKVFENDRYIICKLP